MSKKFFAGFLATSLVLSACAQTEMESAANGNTVKIGVVIPLSGDAAAFGLEVQRVLDAELPLLNELYAEEGYRFELVYEDGKCSGPEAGNAFQKLTDVDDVHFIVGGACSSESLAMVSLLEEKNVVLLSPTSSSPELIDSSDNFFSFSYNDNVIGEAVADELGQYKTVAIITEQNDYNVALLDVVNRTLEERYPETKIVANESFVKGGTEFRNSLQKIKTANPEVVFLNPNVGMTATALVRQLGELSDWHPNRVATFAFAGQETLGLGAAVEGTIVLDAPTVTNEKLLLRKAAIVEEKGTLDNLGGYFTASTLDLLTILTQLIVEHDADPADVRTALAEEHFQGYLGDIYFGGENFIQNVSAARFTVANGELTEL